MKILIYLFVASLVITGISCSKEESPCTKLIPSTALSAVNPTQLAADITAIDKYLSDSLITALADPTGLRYVIHEMGSGITPCLESNIVVTYKGKLMNNDEVFDEGDSIQFPLRGLIIGWQIGLLNLHEGTSATLYIPSGLAYGAEAVKDINGNTIIPANSNLIFDIELIDVR